MAQATVLVASPRAIGSTPVASGSSVPPCPALAAPVIRRTAPTAWLELSPSGLSRMTQPWMGRPPRLRPIAVFVVPGAVAMLAALLGAGDVALDVGAVQERLDAAGMIEGGVELEAQRRHVAQIELARDQAAHEAGATLQRGQDLRHVRAAERHDESSRVLEIGADADFRHRDR